MMRRYKLTFNMDLFILQKMNSLLFHKWKWSRKCVPQGEYSEIWVEIRENNKVVLFGCQE